MMHLRRRIGREGPLTIAAFMEEALLNPAHGYYTTRDPFGLRGDFVTAPEISQMFGELIGAWCAVVWQGLGRPDPILLVELGPGRGTLMADLLRAAHTAPGFNAAVRVHLVEISPALRACQRAALEGAPLSAPPTWHEGFATVPDGPLLVIANEFFDALPIRQLQRAEGAWRERLVDLDEEGNLRFVLSPPTPAEVLIPRELRDAPEGAVVEVSPTGIGFAHAVAARIVRDRGAALIIDYGHPESACGDTLQAVKGHAPHEVLADPGDADLTAHVDFAALARAAHEAGATVFGPIPQGAFLARLGLAARAQALSARATAAQIEAIDAAVRRLTDAAAMGALFKVLALMPRGHPTPPGFET
jgi:NADH dehydrogenase [ubiquinone] 1 alpha subcomplex assembly factor 7